MASHELSIGTSDEYYTPKYIFDALGFDPRGLRFDMDVAAPYDQTYCHVPADRFITEDSLLKEWEGLVWMNPPFGGRGDKSPWLNRLRTHGNGIGLFPDRTSAPWWQDAAPHADLVLFVKKKIQFIRPDGSVAKQPGTGTTLFAYGDFAAKCLIRATRSGLGQIFKPYN